MGLYYKSDGLKSYYLINSVVYQRAHTTAYIQSGSSHTHYESGLFTGMGVQSDSVYLSSDGTSLYILYTVYTVNTSNQGYLKEYTLSTAWDLSSVDSTSVTTLTFPLGTAYSIYSGKSARQRWSGLEFASDGSSFSFLRYEDNGGTSAATNQSKTFRVVINLSVDWNVASNSLGSTTNIPYTNVTGWGGRCYGYHTMSGGEIVLSMGGNFIQLSSITDTTADYQSSLAGETHFWFSEDETLLLQSAFGVCAAIHIEIETDYVGGAVVSSVPSSTVISTKFNACSESFSQTYYHDGAGSLPAVNDTCYSDDPGFTTLAAGKYRMGTSTVSSQIIVNSSGVVTSASACAA